MEVFCEKVFYENTEVTFFMKLLAVDSGTGVVHFGKFSDRLENHIHVFFYPLRYIFIKYNHKIIPVSMKYIFVENWRKCNHSKV